MVEMPPRWFLIVLGTLFIIGIGVFLFGPLTLVLVAGYHWSVVLVTILPLSVAAVLVAKDQWWE